MSATIRASSGLPGLPGLRGCAFAVLMGCLVQVSPASAAADGATAKPNAALRQNAISAAELEARSADAASADGRARAKKQLLQASASNGVLFDSSEVDSSVVDGTTVAWTESVDVGNVVVTTRKTGGTSTVDGLGVEGSIDPDGADAALGNLGSDKLVGVSGQWGDPTGGVVRVTNNGFTLISGWQRYRVRESKKDREVYFYGHWATAVGKDRKLFDASPMVIDIRSRPKRGQRSNFLQVRDYWPKSERPSCSSHGDISVGAMGFGASMPLQNCSSLSPDPDTNTLTMKVVWSAGACKDQRTEGADLAYMVDTKAGKNAIISDYSYVRFSSDNAACDRTSFNDTRVIYADPGW